MITAERLQRLPHWAKAEIVRLERELERANRFAEVCMGRGVEETDTLVRLDWERYMKCETGTAIRFLMKEGRHEWIDVRKSDHNQLYICGGRGITVGPQCGNVITVGLVE